MPTYEYRCNSCNYYFEEFQSIRDEPIKNCPKCGEAVRKLISTGAGLIFKGSGFYETDYKHKNSSYNSNGNGKHHGNGDGKDTKNEKAKETKTGGSVKKVESTSE